MTTYSISLDDVDLALLPARSYRDDLRRELYEFQLLGTDEDQHTYRCHICAIDVPSAFAAEHEASAKHDANVRIASEATQRMRSLLTAHPPPHRPHPAGKFCDACSTIADKNHEKTKEHKLAVIQDRMLRDLMKVYVSDNDEGKANNDGVIDNKHPTDDGPNVNHEAEEPNTSRAEDTVNRPEQVMLNGDTKQTKYEPEIKAYNEILKAMNHVNKDKVVLKYVDDTIQIIVNNEQIIVSYDNFHGYHRLEGKIQCRLCYITMPLDQEEFHKITSVHISRLLLNLKDGDCIRQIYENWSHCIICNQVFKSVNADGHKTTRMHKENRRLATVPTQQCGNTEPKHDFEIPTSSRATVHEEITVPSTSKYDHNTAKSEVKTVSKNPIEYPYEKTENPRSVYCVLCKCAVPSTPSNLEGHLKGFRHANSARAARK